MASLCSLRCQLIPVLIMFNCIGRRAPVDDITMSWVAVVTVLFIGTRWWKHALCVDIGNLQCHTIERQCGLWSGGIHAWLASKSVYRAIVIVTAIVSITDSSYSFTRHAMSDCSLTNPFLYITGIYVRKIKVCKAQDGARGAVKRPTLVRLGQPNSCYHHRWDQQIARMLSINNLMLLGKYITSKSLRLEGWCRLLRAFPKSEHSV